MPQDIAVGQMTACDQRMIGAAKPRIGHFDQHLASRHRIIGHVFIDEAFVFAKYNGFHRFSFFYNKGFQSLALSCDSLF